MCLFVCLLFVCLFVCTHRPRFAGRVLNYFAFGMCVCGGGGGGAVSKKKKK